MQLKQVIQTIILFIGTFGAGFVGSLFTTPNIPTWYAALDKPPFIPPNGTFGIVWNILYFMMAVSICIIWFSSQGDKTKAYAWYAAQLILNTLWSFVFFGLQLPWLGVIVITLLIVSIIQTIRSFRPISSTAAWLLVPYLAWVLFAAYLTAGIAILN